MAGIQTNFQKLNFDPKITKRVIAIIVIAAIGVTATTVYLNKGKNKVTTQTQLTSKVAKGNFNISITGTGTVASSNTASVSPKTGGTVTKVYFDEGDVVKKGDLLYEMDDSSAKLDIEKIKNSIATAQLSSQDNISNITKLNITAPFNGILTSIPVKEGDSAAKSSLVATIVDKSRLKLTVPVKVDSQVSIREGNSALVHVQTLMQTIEGTITLVTSPIITSDGMKMVNLEVTVPNTGTLSEGLKANVELYTGGGSVFSTDTGSLSYINSSSIKTETGGTVSQIYFKEGQAISAGDAIMTLSSSDLQLTKQTNDIKMKELLQQLDTAQQQLDYYKVYSTIDGTITSQSLHSGDAVKVAEVTTKIANVKELECSIAIDELDIAKVKVGQKTTITADALTETVRKPLVGAVKSIGVSGTTTNGVTTYPVVVSIPYIEGMRPGMNISVEIFVQEKQGTLTVPIEAIQKVGTKNYVYIKGGTGNGYEELTKLMQEMRQKNSSGNSGSAGSGNRSSSGSSSSSSSGNRTNSSSASAASTAINYLEYYKNTSLKEVELGINNASYIEILSGVSEGDEVVLPPKTTTKSTTQSPAGVGGFGVMGGAPPSQGQTQQRTTTTGGAK